ncbi:helix-turn-helix transcriptional regulator, partial [Paraburkholderia kururiensis]|uniref:helix-turn-helix transcriptional regulator n=1 Tax=Paraburkholderia kururiensis TaxID=984307 RepID=UPI00110C7288
IHTSSGFAGFTHQYARFLQIQQHRFGFTALLHTPRTIIQVRLPIHGPRQEAGMLCFVNDSNPNDKFWQHIDTALPNLVLMRDLVIDTSQRHLSAHAQTLIPKLTPRERECLKWTALGKSTWEISHILNCSEAVVNFHMKNIRAKFGVNSRRAAAVIATQLGLIDPG